MDSLIFYWVLTLVVLLILIMLTGVETASIITVSIILIRFMTQPYYQNNDSNGGSDGNDSIGGFEVDDTPKKDINSDDKEETHVELPKLTPEAIAENTDMLEDVLYPKTYSADDKIFDASVNSGYKNKKALEIRSHWNNNNWKRYYDYELGIHEQENRDWWTDDDFELSKKHVVI